MTKHRKKCDECESKHLEEDLQTKFIESIVNRKVNVCSDGCFDVIKVRTHDEINSFVKRNLNNLDVDIYSHELEKLKSEIRELNEKIEEEFFKGYTEGFTEIIKVNGLCPRCKKHIIESIHHIIPREYGGYNQPEILIALCFKCHNEVELLTDELFKQGKRFDIFTLRRFITEKAFPNETQEAK